MARLTLTLLALGAFAAGCSSSDRYVLIGNANSASSAGLLKVDADSSGSDITVHLEFLPAPSQRDPEHTQYVVWFATPDGNATVGAALPYKRDHRSADLELRGPPPPYELFVTAEAAEIPERPSADRVLSQAVSAD